MIFKANLTQQVYALLRDRIVRRELVPGERVDIDTLARQLEISRTPVREALTRLANEGLITVAPHRGTFVSRPSAQEFVDLLDLRLALELWGASHGLGKLAETDVLELRSLYEGMANAIAHLDENPYEYYLQYVALNQCFHGTIVQSAGNKKLVEIYRSIDAAAQIQRVIFPLPKEELELSNEEHRQILAAIEANDWPALEQAITTHVETVKSDVLHGLEQLAARNGHQSSDASLRRR